LPKYMSTTSVVAIDDDDDMPDDFNVNIVHDCHVLEDVVAGTDKQARALVDSDCDDGDAPAAKRGCVAVDETDESEPVVTDGADFVHKDRHDDEIESHTASGKMTQVGPLRFKTAEQLFALMSDTDKAMVYDEVPRGLKENVWFIVDNKANVQRREAGKKGVYWDDCGVWSSKDGRVLTTHYVRVGTSLSVVKMQDGKVCKRQLVNGKRVLVPLQVQPMTDDIVTISSYYATLKSDSSYRKRVSWLVLNPDVAVYEYQGKPPQVNAVHGLQRKSEAEFVRTKPSVLSNIRAGLQEKNAQPRQVYEYQMLANESSERPRDHKQVRNVAQTVAGESGQRKKWGNVADDVQSVLTSVQTHPYVKEVCIRHNMSPAIICYTDEQIADLKRFCSSKTPTFLRTVLGFDRTFNLGPCYVTVTVYRNLSVVRKSTSDNPIFLGPVMFHFDGKAETYRRFFSTLSDLLCGDVSCAEFAGDVELVFGSDEEKAMVAALRQVFPAAEHIFCARHLEENVRRFLTDTVGMATRDREQVMDRLRAATRVDANQTTECETAVSGLLEAVRASASATAVPDKVVAYFSDRVCPKLRNNMKVLTNNGWIARHWTNNNAESANHILKLKADWRQLPVSSCVENVYDIVRLQYVELRSALTGRGNYTLAPAFSRHLVPYQTWSTAEPEKKDKWFSKFLRDTGMRVHDKTVTSQDGGLTMPATPKVARKPGQQRRARGARTVTSKLKTVTE